MKIETCDVLVVGAGPAGLASAVSARKAGASRVLMVERDRHIGGILQQCIHAGFGLQYFGQELTGPEYAEEFSSLAENAGVEILLDTTALEIREDILVCVNKDGILHIHFGALVLAMGCREKTRANLVIPGSRTSGIYTAGTAQKMMNIYGHCVGREVVILGSGDIGMIMARRLTLQGAKVKAVVELLPYLAGLPRNKVQCLDDFDIPLLLSHTIIDISGVDRVNAVTVAPVDKEKQPLKEQAWEIPCDTLLLSVGLIPENELTKTAGIALSALTRGAEVDQYRQTDVPGIFACGNVLHVNDLVDNVTRESEIAGRSAALYVQGKLPRSKTISVIPGEGVRYVCPQRIVPNETEDVTLFFRTTAPGRNTVLSAVSENRTVAKKTSPATSPGTMEQLTLPASAIKDLTKPVSIQARHEEGPA